MKKVLAFLVLAAMLAACSQYTCPTYAKKEVKKAGKGI
jgi:PBP1b-binding outer membrane lipoprotein LpoB